MLRKTTSLLILFFSLLFASAVYAQEQPEPQHTDPTWQAIYWNNQTLSGAPALQRAEADINWDWGTGSPDPAITPDNFSARWTKVIDVPAGSYRFTATTDDGIRLWVDDQPIINQWYDHPAQTYSEDVPLSAGHHTVRVEYYENSGFAAAKVSWGPTPIYTSVWRGDYFDNQTLSGAPVLARNDAFIDYNWSNGSPAPTIPADHFSVRWTHTLTLPAGNYRFTTRTDDGVRLWVNDHLLIDQWHDMAVSSHSGVIYVGGTAVMRMEYYENTGLAEAHLSWELVGSPPPPAGTVIVDDLDAGFVKGGAASSWRTEAEGYNGRLLWTHNNDTTRSNYNWARWYPQLAAGQRYEVFVYIPDRFTTTAQARYWISHRDGYILRMVNQSAYSNQWVSLGTYTFRGTANDYVSLADVTYEPYLSRLIAFDAVKFERR